MSDPVNHPDHYGGKNNPYEAIKVINAWELNFNLGNAVKYIARAGKKDPSKIAEDLKKAAFYLNDEIKKYEDSDKNSPQAKGGKARAEKLTESERRDIAQKAANTRWGKND